MVYIYAVHKSEDTDVIEKVKCTNHFGIQQDIDKTKEFMVEFINAHPDSVSTAESALIPPQSHDQTAHNSAAHQAPLA